MRSSRFPVNSFGGFSRIPLSAILLLFGFDEGPGPTGSSCFCFGGGDLIDASVSGFGSVIRSGAS